MRATTDPRTQSKDPLHHAPIVSMYSSPLQFSLEEWKGFAMEEKRAEKGNFGSNSKHGCKILGQRGILKWVEFLFSRYFF
jgi:hypothetical protein